MKQPISYIIIMLVVIASGSVISGCTDTVPVKQAGTPATVIPEPETGIAAWAAAVNERDYSAVYDLMPVSKRAGITRAEYIRLNRENPSSFLASGQVIGDFMILSKNIEGLNATVFAGFQVTRPSPGSSEAPEQEMVFFTFEESFEEDEWKVWTRK